MHTPTEILFNSTVFLDNRKEKQHHHPYREYRLVLTRTIANHACPPLLSTALPSDVRQARLPCPEGYTTTTYKSGIGEKTRILDN